MNRDAIPVAELNLPFTGVGKFSWELEPTGVIQISRKSVVTRLISTSS